MTSVTQKPTSGEKLQWDWPLQGHDGIVKVTEDDKHFEVGLDATYFETKDISVKCIGDMIQIHFEHEIKNDKFGTIRREITRCYKLPDRVDPKTIKSNLANGVLFVTGQKKTGQLRHRSVSTYSGPKMPSSYGMESMMTSSLNQHAPQIPDYNIQTSIKKH